MRLTWTLLIGALLVFATTNASFAASAIKATTGRSSEPIQAPSLQALRVLLKTPDAQLDFAKAKLTIDRMIDPRTDVPGKLEQLDAMAAQVAAMNPIGASPRAKLVALMAYLYQPGPWNGHRVFSYDFDDPFGRNIRNKLLSTYLATRKGNCVSMPILFVILAQKIGLEATLSTAPTHVFAKIRDDDGRMFNVENTSGGTKSDEGYQREYAITEQAIKSGIYLQSLTRRENVAVMLDTLMEYYGQQGQYGPRIAVAELALIAYSNDVNAMLYQAGTHYRIMKQRYLDRYASLSEMTPAQIEDYERLGKTITSWAQKAENLGWRENTPTQDAAYEQKMQQIKASQPGG